MTMLKVLGVVASALLVVACAGEDESPGSVVGNQTDAGSGGAASSDGPRSCVADDEHGDSADEATKLANETELERETGFTETSEPLNFGETVGQSDEDWFAIRVTEIMPADFKPELVVKTGGDPSEYQACIYYPERTFQISSPCAAGEEGPSKSIGGETHQSCCGVPASDGSDALVLRFDFDRPIIDDAEDVFIQIAGPEDSCSEYKATLWSGYWGAPRDWPEF